MHSCMIETGLSALAGMKYGGSVTCLVNVEEMFISRTHSTVQWVCSVVTGLCHANLLKIVFRLPDRSSVEEITERIPLRDSSESV